MRRTGSVADPRRRDSAAITPVALLGIGRPAAVALAIAFVAGVAVHAQTAPPATIAERATFFDELAREQSTAKIEQLIRDARASTGAAPPHYALEALFERYFELDPAGAVRFAGAQHTPPIDVFQSMYARLASRDPNAALAALSLVDSAPLAQIAAATIVRVLGPDLKTVDLVAAALHAGSADQFRADALTGNASLPPREALAAALRLGDPERRTAAATMIVTRWAQDAPADAIEEAERVADPTLRATLRRFVLQSWRDVPSLLTYLSGLDAAARRAALAAGVLTRLAEADPERAAQFALGLPSGPERNQALQQVAVSYAQKDGAAAFKWVQSLDPPQPDVVRAVIGVVAARDPLRAFDLATSLAEPARTQALYTAVGGNGGRDQGVFEQLAGRVVALPEGQSKVALLMSLLTSWAQTPDQSKSAIEWALAHAAALPPAAFRGLGYSLAQFDADAAATYLDRMPSAARGEWIGAIALGYSRSDPQRALSFIEHFRGDPAYDAAAAALVPQLASSDPPAAARLLASITSRPPNNFGAEMQIAREWAQRDPQAAAAWALDLPVMQRSLATGIVGEIWGQSNPRAVRDWALGLPTSDKRDFALAAALRAQGAGEPDPTLLAAFSDDRPRQAALMNTIILTAATDAALARRLVEEHITDPRLRPQAEQIVESAARGGMPLPTTAIRSPVTGLAVPAGVLVSPNGIVSAPPFGALPASPPVYLQPGNSASPPSRMTSPPPPASTPRADSDKPDRN